jgi:hypothetical protein
MTTSLPAPVRTWRSLAFIVTLVVAWSATNALAQAPAAPGGAAPATPPDELEKLVDRIALYPDDLVAIILPASTNPLQIVQADRFLEKRKADPKAPIDDKWDDAVKSLLNYPEVVKTMSSDLDWTAALGEAVVADQGEVLEAIQAFRRKTQSAGNLKTDEKQVVVVEKEVIKIEPADPQVIYVPQYNPTTVVVSGGYPYGYYPSPYPVYYYPYPPGAALATGLIWGAAIGAVWGGARYGCNYGGNANININRNTNINTGNINTGNRGQAGGGSSQWKSNKQPGQVSKSVGATPSNRVGDSRGGGAGAGGAPRASTQDGRGGGGGAGGGGAGAGGAPRASTQDGRGGGGGAGGGGAGAGGAPRASTQDGRGGGGGGSGAFDGYGSGRQSQMDSSRGAASRSGSAGGGRSAGGGGRGGGGGGGRGGGRR